MKMQVNTRRFFAFSVLAVWIGLTPVVIATAIQWSKDRVSQRVEFQRSIEMSDAIQDATTARELAGQTTRVKKSLQSVSDALLSEQIHWKEFCWEFFVWVVLILLGSALLAERGGFVQ